MRRAYKVFSLNTVLCIVNIVYGPWFQRACLQLVACNRWRTNLSRVSYLCRTWRFSFFRWQNRIPEWLQNARLRPGLSSRVNIWLMISYSLCWDKINWNSKTTTTLPSPHKHTLSSLKHRLLILIIVSKLSMVKLRILPS